MASVVVGSVTLELTPREASVLLVLTGSVAGLPESLGRAETDAIFTALDRAGITAPKGLDCKAIQFIARDA